VRDDGSTDGTVGLLEAAAAQDPRIVLVHDGRGNLGPARSFGVLMETALAAGAAHVGFADQDDVWEPGKLEEELGLLRDREAELGHQVPLLVHSDLSVVDEDLRLIHPSFFAHQRVGPGDHILARLLVQNFVAGCTMVINRSLLRASLPLPDVIMHDWWVALCAAALGEVRRDPRPTVKYRQHGGNAAGSRSWLRTAVGGAAHPVRWWRASRATFAATVAQACALAVRLEREGSADATSRAPALVREYCDAFSRGTHVLSRIRTVRRHRVEPRSVLGAPIFHYARVALWPGG
jgi:glycosyltransferase involved in cell wall biosynthesis